MDMLLSVFDFLKSDTGVSILGGLLILSEALGGIPAVKANSVYQLIMGLLEKVGKRPAA